MEFKVKGKTFVVDEETEDKFFTLLILVSRLNGKYRIEKDLIENLLERLKGE